MFSITIAFGPANGMWRFLYRTKEAAEKAWNSIKPKADDDLEFFMGDDFGQEAAIARASVSGMMLEDMNQSMLANIEMAMHQMRTQAKGQEMAESDAVLRASRARTGGPSIIQPFQPNGGFGPRQ